MPKWSFCRFFPLPFVNLDEDVSICESEELILDATTNDVSYQWQNGATTATIQAIDEGIYTVTITSTESGCIGRDQISVNHLPPPIFNLGAGECDLGEVIWKVKFKVQMQIRYLIWELIHYLSTFNCFAKISNFKGA